MNGEARSLVHCSLLQFEPHDLLEELGKIWTGCHYQPKYEVRSSTQGKATERLCMRAVHIERCSVGGTIRPKTEYQPDLWCSARGTFSSLKLERNTGTPFSCRAWPWYKRLPPLPSLGLSDQCDEYKAIYIIKKFIRIWHSFSLTLSLSLSLRHTCLRCNRI